MTETTPDDVFVMLCDWRGRCTWRTSDLASLQVGEVIWQHLAPESQEAAKNTLARVVTLRESQNLEVINLEGERFRVWFWPLDSPEVAACVLGKRVPQNLALLTGRERDCLELLGQGVETRLIARRLDVSLSTIHTHLKRAREKLGLSTVEALISFAARFCYPADQPFGAPPA